MNAKSKKALVLPSAFLWSWKWDSNPRPVDYESTALPTEPFQHLPEYCIIFHLVCQENYVRNSSNIYFLSLLQKLYISIQCNLAKTRLTVSNISTDVANDSTIANSFKESGALLNHAPP